MHQSFSGTFPLFGHSIPVVGRYYSVWWDRPTQWTLAEPYYASLLFFFGLHLRDLRPGTTPSLSVTSYMAYDYTGNIENLLNKEYDNFSLTSSQSLPLITINPLVYEVSMMAKVMITLSILGLF